MTTVAMSATTAAAATAASFFTRGSIVAGPSGGEGGKFFVQLGGAAVRTFRALPIGGAHEDFAVAATFFAMEFVDWHSFKLTGAAGMFKRGAGKSIEPPARVTAKNYTSGRNAAGSLRRSYPQT